MYIEMLPKEVAGGDHGQSTVRSQLADHCCSDTIPSTAPRLICALHTGEHTLAVIPRFRLFIASASLQLELAYGMLARTTAFWRLAGNSFVDSLPQAGPDQQICAGLKLPTFKHHTAVQYRQVCSKAVSGKP
jgi:hypothetical protein